MFFVAICLMVYLILLPSLKLLKEEMGFLFSDSVKNYSSDEYKNIFVPVAEKPKEISTDKTKPTDSGKTTPTNATSGGSSSGSGTSGGNTSSGKTVTDNVIKTTGTGMDTSAVAGMTAAGVVVAAAGAAYAFKTRKERA